MSVVAVAAIVVIPSARACFVVKFAWTSVNAMRAVRVAGVAWSPAIVRWRAVSAAFR